MFAIERESEMTGCADLIRGYPDPATAMLGLLLVSERYRREVWARLGFAPTGEVKPCRYGAVASEIVVFQKSLPGTP